MQCDLLLDVILQSLVYVLLSCFGLCSSLESVVIVESVLTWLTLKDSTIIPSSYIIYSIPVSLELERSNVNQMNRYAVLIVMLNV